jgi:hypothetical protein
VAVTIFGRKATQSVLIAATVAAVGSAGLALARAGSPRPAPRVGQLPVANDARVITSAPGGSAVDSASDRKRYRYLAIAGQHGERTAALLRREVRLLRRDGWQHEYVSRCVWVPKLHDARCQRTSITAPGASVSMDSPVGSIYVALSGVIDQNDALQQEAGTPLRHSQQIKTAIRKRRPVLFGFLGNGHHS